MTVAVSVPPLPSEIVYVNVVVPLKFGAGCERHARAATGDRDRAVRRLRHRRDRQRLAGVGRDRVVREHGDRRRARSPRPPSPCRRPRSADRSTGVTVTVTVAVSVPPLPSEIVYVNVVGAGEVRGRLERHARAAAVMTTVPFAGCVDAVIVSVSPGLRSCRSRAPGSPSRRSPRRPSPRR